MVAATGKRGEGEAGALARVGDQAAATPLPPNIGDPIYVTTYVTVDPAASTGRFAGAEGEIVLHAELVFEGMGDPAWPWTATWTGTLSY